MRKTGLTALAVATLVVTAAVAASPPGVSCVDRYVPIERGGTKVCASVDLHETLDDAPIDVDVYVRGGVAESDPNAVIVADSCEVSNTRCKGGACSAQNSCVRCMVDGDGAGGSYNDPSVLIQAHIVAVAESGNVRAENMCVEIKDIKFTKP